MQPGFQSFQREFGRHLRDPRHVRRPAGTPQRRVAVYAELVFNNLCGFLDSCFPVCREILGEARWRRLCRTFQRDWPMHTPWFREIPREFVCYVSEADISQPLPRWFSELAHYEWAELAVDILDVARPEAEFAGNLLDGIVVLNPALMNLAYDWPVQLIGPAFRPRKQQRTHMVVYRDADDAVRFSEVTPPTARLIDLFATEPLTGRQAILRLADEIGHPNPQQLLAFGIGQLDALRQQGIILGRTT